MQNFVPIQPRTSLEKSDVSWPAGGSSPTRLEPYVDSPNAQQTVEDARRFVEIQHDGIDEVAHIGAFNTFVFDKWQISKCGCDSRC